MAPSDLLLRLYETALAVWRPEPSTEALAVALVALDLAFHIDRGGYFDADRSPEDFGVSNPIGRRQRRARANTMPVGRTPRHNPITASIRRSRSEDISDFLQTQRN